MYCFFCNNYENTNWLTDINCNYMICWNCWASMIPKYITNHIQKWKFIQMRGDKISETL